MLRLALRKEILFRQLKTATNKNDLKSSIKTLKNKVSKKVLGAVGVVTAGVTTFAAYKIFVIDMSTGIGWLNRLLEEKNEEKNRRNMIGNDVAHGLAWAHYCGYLQHVLPVIKTKLEGNEWYKGLSNDEKKRFPIKLYELIPRKCCVDIQETDDNMTYESCISVEALIAGDTRPINIPIYSINDGKTKYYCLYDCPNVLKTINTMNDIQLAGISQSQIPSFTLDTKLIQLMRFYYAMNSFLCIKIKEEDVSKNARLLLFQGLDKKPSDVLLHAIKEDLKVNKPEQKINGSLMENKLLYADEMKDIVYDFDVFVTHPEKVTDKEDLNKINEKLKDEKMKVLLEKDCLGQDWLEKIRFAATKCRWIVFLDPKGSKSKTFMSTKDVDSLKSILETRKVQTVVIANRREELYINDGLRWVTCIPYQDNTKLLMATLCNVVSGSEVKLKNAHDLYLKPGEAAIGLAWGYAVNYLNRAIPDMKEGVAKIKDNIDKGITFPDKLFLVVPESCNANDKLKGIEFYEKTRPSSNSLRSFEFSVYKLNKSTYVVGQYPETINTIRKMEETDLIDEIQMKTEVKTYYNTVANIMRIFYPEKRNNYEFVYYNDTKTSDRKRNTTLKEILSEKVRQ